MSSSIEDRLCQELEYRIVLPGQQATGWKAVGEHWRIAKCRLRDLGPVWRENMEWRLQRPMTVVRD